MTSPDGVGGTGVACAAVGPSVGAATVGCATVGAEGVSVTSTIAGVRVGVGVGVSRMQPLAASRSIAMISSEAGSRSPARRLLCVGKRLIGSILPSGGEAEAQYIIPAKISQRQQRLASSAFGETLTQAV